MCLHSILRLSTHVNTPTVTLFASAKEFMVPCHCVKTWRPEKNESEQDLHLAAALLGLCCVGCCIPRVRLIIPSLSSPSSSTFFCLSSSPLPFSHIRPTPTPPFSFLFSLFPSLSSPSSPSNSSSISLSLPPWYRDELRRSGRPWTDLTNFPFHPGQAAAAPPERNPFAAGLVVLVLCATFVFTCLRNFFFTDSIRYSTLLSL